MYTVTVLIPFFFCLFVLIVSVDVGNAQCHELINCYGIQLYISCY